MKICSDDATGNGTFGAVSIPYTHVHTSKWCCTGAKVGSSPMVFVSGEKVNETNWSELGRSNNQFAHGTFGQAVGGDIKET
jgi:hypothetical protein